MSNSPNDEPMRLRHDMQQIIHRNGGPFCRFCQDRPEGCLVCIPLLHKAKAEMEMEARRNFRAMASLPQFAAELALMAKEQDADVIRIRDGATRYSPTEMFAFLEIQEVHEVTASTCKGEITNQPSRIQRKRTKGWRMPENTVCISRPSKWGNPHKVGPDCSLETAIRRYELDLECGDLTDKNGTPLIGHIEELRGQNLACFCPLDSPCHGDVLLEISNR